MASLEAAHPGALPDLITLPQHTLFLVFHTPARSDRQLISHCMETGLPPPCPFSEDSICAYVQFLRGKPDCLLETGVGEALACLGLNAPSVLKALWGIGAGEAAWGVNSNVRSPTISRLTKKMKKDWQPEGAPSFDIRAELPRLRKAMFSDKVDGRRNPLCTGLARVRAWVLFLLSFCCLARSSLFSSFCPTIHDLALPEDDAEYCADGLPMWLEITFRRWKGNPGNKTQVRGSGATFFLTVSLLTLITCLWQTLTIRRNMIHPEFCPVIALLLWLKLSGITSGQLFPDCSDFGGGFITHGVSCSAEKHASLLSRFFKFAGGSTANCTSHSLRKAGVSWAARCQLSDSETLLIGRWVSTSKSFMTYREHGLLIEKQFRSRLNYSTDPIWSFWAFPTSHTGATVIGSRRANAAQ